MICFLLASAADAADDWTQKFPSSSPSTSDTHALACIGGDHVVLFGGADASGWDDETWTFGGGDYYFPFETMALDIAMISANTARISWSAVAGATDYDLYRSTTAFFSGSGAPWQTVAAPATYVDFSDGVGDPSTNYYVLGKARNTSQTSPESNIVGEFDLDIEHGQ